MNSAFTKQNFDELRINISGAEEAIEGWVGRYLPYETKQNISMQRMLSLAREIWGVAPRKIF